MALVRVRAKKTETNPEPSAEVIEVDEGWLERWPEDFDLVRDETPAEAPAAPAAAKAPAAAEQPSERGRF